jgi:hypothetical protein
MVAQIFLLAYQAEAGWPDSDAMALALVLGAGLFAGALALGRRSRPLLDMVLVTVCVGGLGMAIGATMDGWLAPNVAMPCHAGLAGESSSIAGTPGAWTGLLSWMNLLMLATCIPACAVLCEPCSRSSPGWRVVTHGLCALGMMLGMFAGGWALSPGLALVFGPAVGPHVAMVTGMAGGVAAGWLLLHARSRRRRP